MNIHFDRDQVRELEDKIVNLISPIYSKLEAMKEKGLKQSDVDMMLERVDKIVKYVRSLYPEGTALFRH